MSKGRAAIHALAALLVIIGSLAPSVVAAAPTIGIGDQKASMFVDARFVELGIRDARLSVAWDALSYDWQRDELDAWLSAAKRVGARPLITFGRSRVDRRALPSPSRYQYEVRRFRARYPWVKTFATWNEANHCGEPTCNRPALVVAYYRALRRECPTCRVLAAELLDMPNMASWARRFERKLGRSAPTWGLHNYVDTNRFTTTGTRTMLGAVKGEVWLSEVGGLVRRTRTTRIPLNESPQHAARALRWLFNEIVPLDPRLTRVYVYHWQAGSANENWDSALLTPAGRPREAFRVVRQAILQSRR